MSTRTSRCMHMFIYVHIYNIGCLNMSYSISVSDKEMGGGGRLLLLLPIFFARPYYHLPPTCNCLAKRHHHYHTLTPLPI